MSNRRKRVALLALIALPLCAAMLAGVYAWNTNHRTPHPMPAAALAAAPDIGNSPIDISPAAGGRGGVQPAAGVSGSASHRVSSAGAGGGHSSSPDGAPDAAPTPAGKPADTQVASAIESPSGGQSFASASGTQGEDGGDGHPWAGGSPSLGSDGGILIGTSKTTTTGSTGTVSGSGPSTVTAVPEATPALMMACGVLLLGLVRRATRGSRPSR